ncbi:MAG: hypothetical protein WAM60_03805 [Candidatus Promineifilaceae bacterium]
MRLLIACGNMLRQDDGAGLLLAQQLADAWQTSGVPVRHIEVQQLVPELALEIADETVEEVWFVDSRLTVDETDTAVEIRPLSPDNATSPLGHQSSPEMVLLYARMLFDKRPFADQPPAWQITIPGVAFGHSETLSEVCQATLDEAVAQLSSLNGDVCYA